MAFFTNFAQVVVKQTLIELVEYGISTCQVVTVKLNYSYFNKALKIYHLTYIGT